MREEFWRRGVHAVIGFCIAAVLTGTAHSGGPQPLAPDTATAVFAEAKAVSDRDGGATWGQRLYGPMLFVDGATRKIIANEPDGAGMLKHENGVWVGTLPQDMLPANTAVDWQGKRWTMLEWPVWGDGAGRARLLAHEMFHRIQPGLHLLINDTINAHLDTLEGRLWLQLEWRALAVALTSTGKAREIAIRDALAFRAHRASLFAGSGESERVMEINEGLAEYTGVRVGASDDVSARWNAAQKLLTGSEKTWVRSFPYTSGPAYGLLLDALTPNWRVGLTDKADLSAMVAAALPKAAAVDAVARAKFYGEAELRRIETEHAADSAAIKAAFRAKLIDGPVLMLPNLGQHFRVSFDPRDLVPMGEAGTVYPTMQVSDEWGKLTDDAGTLMAPDWQQVFVTAPTETAGSHLKGAGWTLELAPGWKLVPGAKPGSFTVKKD
jgi:hypothetical protein